VDCRFRIPSGETEDLADAEPVLQRVLKAGPGFWNIGSGDSAIERGSPDAPLMLELYFDGRGRFQVRHTPPGAGSVTAQGPKAGKRGATISVGGTPMKLAAGTLLDRDATAEIVKHFCATGEKHPGYAWR
jgi:hypothetical protein